MFQLQVYQHMVDLNHESCLLDAKKIFNVDETSFCTNPRLRKVLSKRGAKNVHTISMGNEKDNYTVLLGGE